MARKSAVWLEHGIDAVAMGLLGDAQLEGITIQTYDRAAGFRSRKHNASGLFTWEREVVTRRFPVGGRVLVTSAGGGREALALLGHGYQVVATECARSLAENLTDNLAEFARAGRAFAMHAAPDHVPAELGPFDAAIIGWGAYSYFIGAARRKTLLRLLLSSLRPGAPVLLSYFGRSGREPRSERAKSIIARALRRVRGDRLPEEGETLASGFCLRHFAAREVSDELSSTGYQVLEEVADGDDSYAVARRPAVPE